MFKVGDRVAVAVRVGNTAVIQKGTVSKVVNGVESVDIYMDNTHATRQISRMSSVLKLGENNGQSSEEVVNTY